MKIADISHYQGNINWSKANQDLDLIIFRATIGLNTDNNYADYVQKCSVPFGVYHYLKASTVAEATEEAKFFYSRAKINGANPLFYCADIEHSTQNASNVNAISTAFADTLRNLGAAKLGLYIGQTLYPHANKDKYDFIWIPRYGKNLGDADINYAPIYPCDLWQYTSVGKVNGIDGNVDLNKLYGEKSLEWFINKEEVKVSERFTNTHFVEFLKQFVGEPYWYGTCVYKCSKSLLQRKKEQYPSHYDSSRTSKYNSDIANNRLCADCIGLAKGYAWSNGGENVIESIGKSEALFKNVYGSNGMPDKSANGMFDYAKSIGLDWGTINTIPEIPGLAVRYDGHVGYYIGNGKVVEERGFNYGCVITNLKERPWLHWYKLPTIKYVSGDASSIVTNNTLKLGDRLLKEGMKGEDVKELQHLLNQYLNLKLAEDGDFGPATLAAVKSFQAKAKLTVDGKYGAKTHAALMSALADAAPEIDDNVVETPIAQMKTNCAANVRAGDSTAYSIITSLPKGTTLTPILDTNNNYIESANKWYAVKCNERIGWISDSVVDIN